MKTKVFVGRRGALWLLSQVVLLFLVALPGGVQDLEFNRLEHFTTADGLSQNWVLRLTQDRREYLGTLRGRPRHAVDGHRRGECDPLRANDFLSKPISKAELLARVRPHLDLLGVHRHLERLVAEKMSKIKVLEGLLPICTSCKKIRNEEGTWDELESFIDSHSEAQFSHGICPDCVHELYSGYKGQAS